MQRENVSRQAGSTCGLWCCHYIEHQMRVFKGQGKAAVEFPSSKRIQEVQRLLKGWTGTMRKACQEWKKDRLMEVKTEADIMSLAGKAAKQLIETKGLHEHLAKALKVQANDGAAPVGIEMQAMCSE